jgi:hypothetical protein
LLLQQLFHGIYGVKWVAAEASAAALLLSVHQPFNYYQEASGYGRGDIVAAACAVGLNKFEVRRQPWFMSP